MSKQFDLFFGHKIKKINTFQGGVVNSTLIGIDLMRKDNGMRGGTIVNIASTAALSTRFIFPLYTSSKHAVLGFTRSLKVTLTVIPLHQHF